MVALSKKQMTVLLLVLVSFIVVLITSMMIIRAINPTMWQHFMGDLPNVISGYH